MFAALALQVATVLVFTTTDCPISNRYVPEIQRLADRFSGSVRFTLVYPVPADTESVIREHVKKFGPALDWQQDRGLVQVKRTGVTVTPEVAVLDATGRLVYRGRIDDRYLQLCGDRPQPTQRDLERTLDAMLAGAPVPVARTRAVGCYLPDLLK
jgi:hypothetical protein